jgi:NitT/TauT family transport system substrate-binding protein
MVKAKDIKNVHWRFFLAMAAICLLPGVSRAVEGELIKTTVAYPSPGPNLLPFLLEKELGLFREEGLSLQLVLVRSGSVSVRGLIAGNFDYGVNVGTILDAAIRARQPLKIIVTTALVRYSLMTQPGIQSMADLKGKKIAVSAIGSDSDIVAREILRRHNLNPLRDVIFVAVGASRERFAALVAGSVQGAMLSPPHNLKTSEMGYREIAKASDYVSYPITGLGVREEKTLANPQEVSKMARAWLKGIKFFVTQRDYLVARLAQKFNLSPEAAAETYEATRETILPSGYLADDAAKVVISTIKQAANITQDIPPEQVFDFRFVKQAEQELKGWKPQTPR